MTRSGTAFSWRWMTIKTQLQAIFSAYHTHHDFSGVGLVKTATDVLHAGAYGYASRPWCIANTLRTRFDTALITKLFTTVAILQLIDRDALSLQTEVIEFLGLTDTTISRQVTVYHLLSHTSGIGDDADEEAGESYVALWQTTPNYTVRQTRDFLPQFLHKPPNFAPGSGCRYNNVGFILLGLMIEQISGLSYRDYIRRHLFAPLGMYHTGFMRMDGGFHDVAEGYLAWPMQRVRLGPGARTSIPTRPLALRTVALMPLRTTWIS
jgi:CubicO group peptidase (beta-lactamase class C family)